MSLIALSAVASVGLLCGIYVLARQTGIKGVCLLTSVTTVLFMCVGSQALFLHSLGSFLLALMCAAFKGGPRAVVLASTTAMIASYWFILSISFEELHERQRLRAQYPLESVAKRLKYEEQRAAHESPTPILGHEIEQRLSRFENRESFDHRSYVLSSLHDETLDSFVMARGFGPIRMEGVGRARLEIPEAVPVPLSVPPKPKPYDPSLGTPVPLALSQDGNQVRPSETALQTMHDGGLEDFLHTERMGYVKDRDHVAGFEPHRFLTAPKLSDTEPAKNQWQVVRLELIGLLKHETPVAYVSQNLPQMDKLKDAPTRPLDDFERRAIERLRSDEDLVIVESPASIRMVGSLRAAKNCLNCHSIRRGELLGAFSYELVPVLPAPVPKDDRSQIVPKA